MSPRSSRDGIHFDTTYSVECTHCGLVGLTPAYDVKRLIAHHYNDRHPDERLIVEGMQYTSYPTPLRCDVCNAVVELPYWSHISDPPTNVPPVIDSDGLWLVCDTCHGLYLTQNLTGLVRRVWAIVKEQSPGMATDPQLQADIRSKAAERGQLLFERWDEGTRRTTEDPGPS